MLGFYVIRDRVVCAVREMRNGKRTNLYYYTGLSSEGFIRERQRFSDKYSEKNGTLLKIEKAARDIISEYIIHNLTGKTFNSLIDSKLNKGYNSFSAFADTWYQKLIEKKGYEGSKQIGTCINKLKDFNPTLTFEEINKQFYEKFVKYLNDQKYSLNTVGLIIKNIKRILNAATDAGLNNNLAYKSFKLLGEDVVSIYLSESEISRIWALKITPELVISVLEVKDEKGVHKFPDIKKKIRALERARKLFIIGCWTGLRVGNYKNIDPNQIIGDYLYVIAIKGGDKLKIPLHRMVKEILADGWPEPMFEQKLNDQIKDLGQLAGINENVIYFKTVGGKRKEFVSPKYDLICTHTARRSFSSNLLLRGIPKQYIMAITGHKTERDFNRYTASVNKDMLTEKLAEFDVWK
jgi:integrase